MSSGSDLPIELCSLPGTIDCHWYTLIRFPGNRVSLLVSWSFSRSFNILLTFVGLIFYLGNWQQAHTIISKLHLSMTSLVLGVNRSMLDLANHLTWSEPRWTNLKSHFKKSFWEGNMFWLSVEAKSNAVCKNLSMSSFRLVVLFEEPACYPDIAFNNTVATQTARFSWKIQHIS